MKRLTRGWPLYLSVALIAFAIAPAYGAATYTGGVANVAVSPGAGAFALTVFIDPAAGDTLFGFEQGRDDTSPYVSIIAGLTPANPAYPALMANPLGAPPPPQPARWPASTNQNLASTMCFVYRPTNDPANPGWGALPGNANQLDNAWQTVCCVASALSQHFTFAAAPPPPPGAPYAGGFTPRLRLELDNTPGSPTYLELYKLQTMHQ